MFNKIFRFLPDSLKKYFYVLLAGMLILAFAETLTVGVIAFYAAAISDPMSTLKSIQNFQIFNFKIYDFLSFHSAKSMIGFLSFVLILTVISKNILSGFITFEIAKFSAKTEAFFGQKILEGFLNKDYLWIIKQNSADLIQKVNWRHHIGRNFLTPHMKIICEVTMLFTLLLALIFIQPLISILFISLQAVMGYLVYKFLKKGLDKTAEKSKKYELEINRQITRSLHGAKDVKMTGTSEYFISNFRYYAEKFSKVFGFQQFWKESPLLVLESMGFALIAFAILFMIFGLGYSPLETTGTTALLAVTAWRTLPAFNRVVSSFAGIRVSKPYVDIFLGVLEDFEKSRYKTIPSNENHKFEFKDKIKFKNIYFAYSDGIPILKDFSLAINKGKSIGIVGPSGCGKSTFVDLLAGLLKPNKGEIYIDDVKLNDNNIFTWQQKTGYVPQFPYIFDGTLAENIAFGIAKENINENKILKVCKMAAIDFLEQLPNSIWSDIGERGVKLSGGQRQRVAIARALYKDPELIIFDEATSALDDENDKMIRELILSLKGKITLVIISHRKSTIEGCDEIVKF
jgi:ABC-type multidrug transport system fused ATPase/permease subunit